MRRQRLTEIISAAAIDAGLPEDRRHELIEAVNDPSVTRVGYGAFGDGSAQFPFCPVTLAAHKADDPYPGARYPGFWILFDDAIWAESRKGGWWHRRKNGIFSKKIELKD